MNCPFCGLDPYEYVDIGVGSIPVAVNCCEDGYAYFVLGWSRKTIYKENVIRHFLWCIEKSQNIKRKSKTLNL